MPPRKASTDRPKRCFVVSEFGTDEATRVERKQTLKHLVKKVLEPIGYVVERADDIDDLGQITHQIIERLLDDDLVVADLTGLNPNVFYELAVRHAARKPVVTLMTHGQTIPFDLKDVRTVFYDLHDPDKLEAAQHELRLKVEAIENNPEDVRNPITVARNVTLLQQSDDPAAQEAGAMLAAIADLRDEVRRLAKQAPDSRSSRARRNEPAAANHILDLLERASTPMTTEEIREYLDHEHNMTGPLLTLRTILNGMVDRGEIARQSDDLWSSPLF
jgi:hypothetical protein